MGGCQARTQAAFISTDVGIYAGNGWMIHSSRYGVALARVDGWYEERFAGVADPSQRPASYFQPANRE